MPGRKTGLANHTWQVDGRCPRPEGGQCPRRGPHAVGDGRGKPIALALKACRWIGFTSPDTAAYARPSPSGTRIDAGGRSLGQRRRRLAWRRVDVVRARAAGRCCARPRRPRRRLHLGDEVHESALRVRSQPLGPHRQRQPVVGRQAPVDGDPVLQVHQAGQRQRERPVGHQRDLQREAEHLWVGVRQVVAAVNRRAAGRPRGAPGPRPLPRDATRSRGRSPDGRAG